MSKKGFTIIEIIICISLIIIMGVGSFVGIRLVNKNIKIDKLEQIQDKLYEAANIYIETNETSYNQLYKSKNGVVIPLSVLKNEGLVDFSVTDLDDEDIENEYIVAALGTTTPQSSGDCIDASLVNSWDSGDKTIYLCTNSDGSTNVQGVGASANNIGRITRERYYYSYNNLENYINYDGNTYRIYFIDKDDSLHLMNEDSFNGVFPDEVTQRQKVYERGDYIIIYGTSHYGIEKFKEYKTGEGYMSANEYVNFCEKDDYYQTYLNGYGMEKKCIYDTTNTFSCHDTKNYIENNKIYKIHLKPCMKITGGVGTEALPYELTNKC